MTSGFDAFSLGLFTSLAPAGVVAFLALALVRLWSRDRTASVRIDRMIALPFSVVLIGFIASATHLGTPANALHVFSGVGRSPLSNEVLSAVAFLFLVGSYWMMAFKERFPDAVAKPWLALACLAGIALIACTSMAYNVDTVPTWDTAFTPANLVLAALLAGPVLGLLFLELAEYFVRIPELFPVENKSWNTVFFSPFQNVSIRDITKDRFYAELRFLSKILNDIFSVRT